MVVAGLLTLGLSHDVKQNRHLSGPISSLLLKVQIVQQNLSYLSSDADLNYWEIEQQEGEKGASSALWRLLHWRDTLQTFMQGGWVPILIGNGIGSSLPITGDLPHNDYLRILFEMGILGFICNIGIWALLFRQLLPAHKWIFLMVATYCFTENNIDNFLVMGIFILFITSARAARFLPPRRTSALSIGI